MYIGLVLCFNCFFCFFYVSICIAECVGFRFLPARTSEQGNVIGLVSVYIYVIVINQTRFLLLDHRTEWAVYN